VRSLGELADQQASDDNEEASGQGTAHAQVVGIEGGARPCPAAGDGQQPRAGHGPGQGPEAGPVPRYVPERGTGHVPGRENAVLLAGGDDPGRDLAQEEGDDGSTHGHGERQPATVVDDARGQADGPGKGGQPDPWPPDGDSDDGGGTQQPGTGGQGDGTSGRRQRQQGQAQSPLPQPGSHDRGDGQDHDDDSQFGGAGPKGGGGQSDTESPGEEQGTRGGSPVKDGMPWQCPEGGVPAQQGRPDEKGDDRSRREGRGGG